MVDERAPDTVMDLRVNYCRGKLCAYAHEAVRRLRAEGRSASRLDGGWPEWQLAEPSRP